jgi:hypothetical protein
MFRAYLAIFRQLFKGHKGHKHGRHKRKIKAEQRESLVLKQTYFSVKGDNAIAWKYLDLRPSAVRRFKKVNNCL